MDNHTIADELEVAYDRCKLWPEHTGDGFMALLELRNLTPDILAALRAPSPAPMGGDVAGLVERLRENDREIFLPLLGEAADMLERLTQPPADAAVAMEQWQPIETAPRDGSKFLVWEEYYGIRIGRCKERADHDDWLSYMDAFGGSSKGGSRATHWMPLLAPPAAIRAGGQP